MKEICISVKSLFERYGEKLTYCTISRDDGNYYDLQTEEAGTVCMDGEVCLIIEENEDEITLTNSDGEIPTTFNLTREEFGIATYI